eukprot:6464115-Pyramimonas_sp.AAC.1
MPTGGRSVALMLRTCRTSSTSTWHAWPKAGRVPAQRGETRQGMQLNRGETRQMAQLALQKQCTSSSR